jgi:autotransporter-associated beta strand protein
MNGLFSRFTALFSAVCLLASTAALAVDSTWIGGAAGNWNDPANWSDGVPQTAADTATLDVPVSVAVPASVTLKTLTVNAPATLTVASGATLAFSNSGSDVIVANADCLVDGAGDLSFSMNGTTGVDYANIKPAAGTTLTLAARVVANGNAGIELNSAGTLRLTNPGNTFTGSVRLSIANGTLAFTHPAALGSGAIRIEGSPSKLVYTGTGPATLALPVQITAGSATLENAGSGTLTFGGEIAPASSGTKTLTFSAPGAAQTNIVTGTLANGSGTLNVNDQGAGTLVLNGTCSYTGTSNIRANRILNSAATAATGNYTIEQNGTLTLGPAGVINGTVTVNGGAALAVEKGATFQNRTLNLNAGATVSFNPSAADGFTVTLPLTNNLSGAGVRWIIPAATASSAVTVPNLVRAAGATLDLAAPGIGTGLNRVFVGDLADGPLPSWFTVNGQLAAYSSADGVYAVTATGAAQHLTALGPSEIQNDPTAAAVIDAAGTAGGITLAADPTTVFSLTQDHAADPAAVDLGGRTLAAAVVAVTAAGNSLTLANGTLSAPAAQIPPPGAAVFPTLPAPPIAWFDLADAGTVATDAGGRISLLANKGSLGAALNAVVPSDRIGPLYIPGAVNGLGVARSDGVMPPQGLATLGNAGIAGNASRTAFLVASRSPVTRNNFYALYLGPDGGGNQDFCIVERPTQTSFSTKSNDLNLSPASPPGHNVLTFITGLDGIPNAGAGFRNGVQIGTKTFSLATVDAPVRLLHRPVTANAVSGPGEVAEALVFDYTLTESDRAAVEAYLMQKWRIAPDSARDELLLALRNDNPAAELAVPAALAEPYGAILSLIKSGPGDVILGGPLSFSGPVLINEGTLTFDTPAGHTAVVAAPVSGPGALVKRGSGGLAFSQSSPYAGGTLIQGGTLYSSVNGSLGIGPVRVESGGALDTANGASGSAIANPVSVEGTGPDGLGALRNSGGIGQNSAFKSVTLTGDTAVYSASRFDARGGTFDFGGHGLTVNGGGEFSIVQSVVSNVPAAAVYVANGMFRFEQSDFKGSAATLASAASGAGICLYEQLVPVQWSLALADNAYFRVNNGNMDTNRNAWAGPVTLAPGTVRLTALAGGTAALTGPVGGDGGLLKEGEGWFWLLNPANIYAGTTAVTQGNLYAVSPGSLGAPAASALTVSGAGAFVARAASAGSPDGWTKTEIEAIATPSVFTTNTASLGIDTVYEDFDYTAGFPYIGLGKLGPHRLTVTGPAPDLGPLAVYNGELDLTGTGAHNLHGHSVQVGKTPSTAALAVLRLVGAALDTDDPGYNRAGPALTAGDAANGRGVVHIGENARANGRVILGNEAGAAGAFYQTSGTVTNTGGASNDSRIGEYGHGYYRLDGGVFACKGYTHLGRNSGATGIIEQRGGSLLINPGTAPATGVIGDYYSGTFSVRGGVGILQLSGGTFDTSAHSLQLGEWSGENLYSNGLAVLTIENGAQAVVDHEIRLANRKGTPEAYVNLNGGTLATRRFQKGGDNASQNTGKAAIAFNGGTLRLLETGSSVRTGANNTPTLLNVYAGGAVIDVIDNITATFDLPLDAPANFGVAAVTVTSPGSGYIAPPAVLFDGACTAQATAFAEIDPVTGALTAVRVTSPGSGYTAAPTVTLRGGGYTATATAALGANASGGLTKLGPGRLTLNAANTYTGPTVVSNGLLRLGAAGARTLTPHTRITLAGGTLDLNGATLTNFHPVVIESGRLAGGTLSAASFTKTGPGTATFTAAPAAPTPAALREAFIRSLGPLVWWDPSDAATVTTDGSDRVSLLRNKGTLGTTHDAIPYSGTGPLYLSGAASPSPLGAGVLHLDNATSPMRSAADVPITGTAPRTLVALIARANSRGSAGIGSGAEGQTFEIGNDPSKTYVSGIGSSRDTQFEAVNGYTIPPAGQLVFIAAANGYGGNFARGVQLWRSDGGDLETLTATWPADCSLLSAPVNIGKRGGTSYINNKVGEVLLFDRVLTADELAALKDCLAAKYLAEPEGGDADVPPVTVAEGTLRLGAVSAAAVASLAPVVWYDPSDAATVTTDATGRVTALLNKGSRGAAMDAATGIANGGVPLTAPLLATGALSYAASGLPMLHIDDNNRGLASASNLGITGTAPRTTVGVFARDNTTTAGPIVTFGAGSAAQLWEFGDRHNGTVVGCFGTGNDLIVTPLNPVRTADVFTAANSGTRGIAFRRTLTDPRSATFNIAADHATANSRFLIGQRPGTANRADFRGQIGELLVFDRLLTEDERSDIEAYLVRKWMTASGAPQENLFDGTVFDVAAGATLDLSGAPVSVTVTGAGAVTNGVLGAGFVVSPAGDAAVGELDLSGCAFTAGATYRLTLSDDACDRIFANGDLSGLTVVPATDAEITGRTYVIATGAITGKPALAGFPAKFKLLQQGDDLLLTSVGGTTILLK